MCRPPASTAESPEIAAPHAAHRYQPWAPLTIPAYRGFWIAGLMSNMGTWMHETGSQWLMTSLNSSPEMVAAVRTAMTVPIFCLALPAGVWADRFDRRRWLIASQSLLLAFATSMALLAALGWIQPSTLLLLTVAMGIGTVLNQPAWQAMTPELVPAAMVPSAVAVGSISFNLARSLGPMLAGILIAQFGVWISFSLNAFSFLGVLATLWYWRPPRDADGGGERARSTFLGELRHGLVVVGRSWQVRNTLLRVAVFAFSASILWSLLSLVATERLQYAERGFGACWGMIGGGAVVAAWFLPRLRAAYSSEAILLGGQLAYAALMAVVAASRSPMIIMPALLVVGAVWMTVMTTHNATAQVHLPRRFRARGMACYLMAFALGMSLGSTAWGWTANAIGLEAAFGLAAVVMVAGAVLVHPLRVGNLHVEQAS